MVVFSPFTPAVDYLRTMLAVRLAAARAKEDGERGASVVEWVVITTIVVAIVVFVGGLLYNTLETKGKDINACIKSAGQGGSNSCSDAG
jgi:Flp pilus assembly pilin Flp